MGRRGWGESRFFWAVLWYFWVDGAWFGGECPVNGHYFMFDFIKSSVNND